MKIRKKVPWVKNENFKDATGLVLESFNYTQMFGDRRFDFTLTRNVLGHVLYAKNDLGFTFTCGCTIEQADDFIINFVKITTTPEKFDVRKENNATHFAIHAMAHQWSREEITNSIPEDGFIHIEFRVNDKPVSFKSTIDDIYKMMEQDIENRAIQLVKDKFKCYEVLEKLQSGIIEKIESFEVELTEELQKILNQKKEKN